MNDQFLRDLESKTLENKNTNYKMDESKWNLLTFLCCQIQTAVDSISTLKRDKKNMLLMEINVC